MPEAVIALHRKKPQKKGPMAVPLGQWKRQQAMKKLGTSLAAAGDTVLKTATAGLVGMGAGGGGEQGTLPPEVEIVQAKEQSSSIIENIKETYTDLLTKNPEEQKEARELIAKQRESVMGIVTEPGTNHESAHLKIVRQWREKIVEEAEKNNIPPQIALAVVLVENSGGSAKVSEKGAVGIFQLMERAAIDMGLKITKDEKGNITYDEREIPEKNIAAGVGYLALQRDRFGGNLGLALIAYHEGPQAAFRQVNHHYVSSESSFDDPTTRNILSYHITKNNISAYSLSDDEYVPRVIAAAEYLIEKEIIEPEKIFVTIPSIPPTPKPRTDGAVV